VTATTYTVYSNKALLGHATFDSTGAVQLLPHKLNAHQAGELLTTLYSETLPTNLQLVEATTSGTNHRTTRSKAEWREFWLAQSLKRNEWAKRKGKPVAERPAPVSNGRWDW
jgi:hypothetical protein